MKRCCVGRDAARDGKSAASARFCTHHAAPFGGKRGHAHRSRRTLAGPDAPGLWAVPSPAEKGPGAGADGRCKIRAAPAIGDDPNRVDRLGGPRYTDGVVTRLIRAG